MGATSKWQIFSRLPSGSLKIGTIVVLRFWTFISFSNQVRLEHANALFYNLQNDTSNGVLHAPIRNHLTCSKDIYGLRFKPKLEIWLAPSFDLKSCILGLHEQCKGILDIYISRPFQWYAKGPIWCLFTFPIKVLNIWDSCTNVTSKMGLVHLGVIGLHPLHSPPFVTVCFTPKHTLLALWALAFHT
jgi:hypothetical protein